MTSPRTWTHRGNVLVHRGKVSGIVDLDHLPIGPRVYDLAYFLANQLALPTAAELVDRTTSLLEAWREFLDGYLSTNRLTAEELTSLAPLTFAVQFQLIGWNLAQRAMNGAGTTSTASTGSTGTSASSAGEA